MTYFKFIKWLVFLNFYMTIIMFGVTTVPQLVLGPFDYEVSVTDNTTAGYTESVDCTQEYTLHLDNYTSSESTFEKVLDVLQGTVSSI